MDRNGQDAIPGNISPQMLAQGDMLGAAKLRPLFPLSANVASRLCGETVRHEGGSGSSNKYDTPPLRF